MRSATLLEGCLGRVSGLKSKRDTLITRAKDKKGGKSGPAAPIITGMFCKAENERFKKSQLSFANLSLHSSLDRVLRATLMPTERTCLTIESLLKLVMLDDQPT